MISPRDAYFLRRLLTGGSSEGELEGVSPEWREVANWLAAMPLDNRLDGWMAFLDGRDDRDEIIRALADVDPIGPPPEASEATDTGVTPQLRWMTVEPGTVLICCDRSDEPPNYGKVVQDLGESCLMIFREGEEGEARVKIHKRDMTFPDGRPLLIPPEGSAPAEIDLRCATLADVRRLVSDAPWPWPGWLAGGVLNALAADPGTGKTLMAFYLACVLWFGRRWPDNQENPFPEGTRTLWVPGDRHYPQLLDLAGTYGLPDEAVLFNAPKKDPTGGLDLDDRAELSALAGRIQAEVPGLAIVDTVGMTTSRNLCRPEDARAYFAPLMDMAQKTGVPFLLLTHLSREAQALGRRIVGACRVVWKMTDPDPEGQPDRRRLWVDKSYIAKPPAMGMTITGIGCSFDFNPPTAPEPNKPGRPPEAREKAEAFIRDALAKENDRVGNELCAEWEKTSGNGKTFWRAVDALVAAGDLTTDGGTGTRRQMVFHLIQPDPKADPDRLY